MNFNEKNHSENDIFLENQNNKNIKILNKAEREEENTSNEEINNNEIKQFSFKPFNMSYIYNNSNHSNIDDHNIENKDSVTDCSKFKPNLIDDNYCTNNIIEIRNFEGKKFHLEDNEDIHIIKKKNESINKIY